VAATRGIYSFRGDADFVQIGKKKERGKRPATTKGKKITSVGFPSGSVIAKAKGGLKVLPTFSKEEKRREKVCGSGKGDRVPLREKR